MLRFRLLGPLEAVAGDGYVALGASKQRALLALLLLNHNEIVASDRLIDLLWSESPPETAGNALQVYVSQLRKALEPERARGAPARVLITRPPGYALRIEPEQLDVLRFEHLVDEGQTARAAGAAERAVAKLREALSLWRGPALADFAYEPWAQADVGRLEELRLTAIEERIEAELELARHDALVAELDALVERHPLRERLQAQRMMALYRAGRQADALKAYQDARAALDEELGLDPGPLLKSLQKRILRQDPALDAVVRPGAKLTGRERRQRRKVVTTLSCEITLGQESLEVDPETLGSATSLVFENLAAIVEHHGGSIQGSAGDRVTAVFGIPTVHEDDALRAVRAALETQAAIERAQGDVDAGGRAEIAIGLETGEVVTGVSPAGILPAGESVRRAVELGRAAAPGEILLGPESHRLTKDAIDADLAEVMSARGGLAMAWRVNRVAPEAAGRLRRMDAPLVGRADERRLLRETLAGVVSERRCNLLTVVAPAGAGKTRLLAEAVSDFGTDVSVLRTRCLSYGEAVTLWPVEKLVREAAGTEGADETMAALGHLLQDDADGPTIVRRLGEVFGYVPGGASVEETFWAVRKLFEALARKAPTVIVFDDIHWAEPTLLDLIEHLVEWSGPVPLLLLCVARAELLEEHPEWGRGERRSVLSLPPLGTIECEGIIRNLLGGGGLQAPALMRIIDAAQGNPLYLEEIVGMLIDDGIISWGPEGYGVRPEFVEVAVPASVQALIAARVDRLAREERQVLEGASIAGKIFEPDALAAVTPEVVHPRVAELITKLEGKDLVRPQQTSPVRVFSFRHDLVRDVVYRAIPKQRRADLHQGFASWLQGTSEWLNEETVGWHLERSYLLRRELGVRGDAQRALGERAASLLTASGQRARTRGDLPSATGLLRRAAPLWPAGTRGRVRNLIDLAACLIDAGDMPGAETSLNEAVAEAETVGDRVLQARASVTLWEARSSTHNVAGWRERALDQAQSALAIFEDEGDEVGLSLAHRLEAMIHQNDYHFAAAERSLEEALRHARSAGDEHEERKILEWYTMSALWGPTPVEEAIARHEDFRRRFGENRLVEAGCLRRIAGFRAMQGSIEEARELLAQSRAILNDLGAGLLAAVTVTPGLVELLGGNARAAERDFRASYEALERLGESNARIVSAAYLARALYDQGRYEEAEGYVQVSEALTPADDLAARTEWAPVKAKLLARRGELGAAEAVAREAVALAEPTDDLSNHAATLADLAEVLTLEGRPDEARTYAQRAVELYERKGNVVLAARTRVMADLS